jgi:hypothetical protein
MNTFQNYKIQKNKYLSLKKIYNGGVLGDQNPALFPGFPIQSLVSDIGSKCDNIINFFDNFEIDESNPVLTYFAIGTNCEVFKGFSIEYKDYYLPRNQLKENDENIHDINLICLLQQCPLFIFRHLLSLIQKRITTKFNIILMDIFGDEDIPIFTLFRKFFPVMKFEKIITNSTTTTYKSIYGNIIIINSIFFPFLGNVKNDIITQEHIDKTKHFYESFNRFVNNHIIKNSAIITVDYAKLYNEQNSHLNTNFRFFPDIKESFRPNSLREPTQSVLLEWCNPREYDIYYKGFPIYHQLYLKENGNDDFVNFAKKNERVKTMSFELVDGKVIINTILSN